MGTTYQICEIAATIAETSIIIEVINRLLGSKYQGVKNIVQLIAAFIILNVYMVTISIVSVGYLAVLDFIGIILYAVYSVMVMKKNLVYRVITPVLSIMLIYIINIIVTIIASYIFEMDSSELLNDKSVIRIFLLFVTKFSFFIITRIVLKIAMPKEVTLNKQELAAVSVVFIISMIIIGFASEAYFNIDSSIDLFIIILLIGLSIINIVTFILFCIISKINHEKLRLSVFLTQYEEQKKTYDSIRSIYSNLQVLQHDMKNELLCLYDYIENNHIEKAKEYIINLSNTRLNQFHEYIKTENEIIDAIINVKLNLAREKKIEVTCNICADFKAFDTNDIVCLFSNAIDNAIESSLSQSDKRISINIENKRNYLFFSIGNSISTSVLDENKNLKTTKKDSLHHGFGIKSMERIIEKYDGMIEFYEKNGMFIVNMMMKCT